MTVYRDFHISLRIEYSQLYMEREYYFYIMEKRREEEEEKKKKKRRRKEEEEEKKRRSKQKKKFKLFLLLSVIKNRNITHSLKRMKIVLLFSRKQ